MSEIVEAGYLPHEDEALAAALSLVSELKTQLLHKDKALAASIQLVAQLRAQLVLTHETQDDQKECKAEVTTTAAVHVSEMSKELEPRKEVNMLIFIEQEVHQNLQIVFHQTSSPLALDIFIATHTFDW